MTFTITDKPDNEKAPAEFKRELQYLRAKNTYLKKLDAGLRAEEKAVKSKAHRRIKIAIRVIRLTHHSKALPLPSNP